jgi:hypothetical protein
MKRFALAALTAAALLGGATAALAGKSRSLTVKMTTGTDFNGNATTTVVGSMRAARNSSDTTQYIGCVASNELTGSRASCTAVDSTGKTATCIGSIDDANQLNTVAAINSASTIRFTVTKIALRPVCTSISVENDSRNL